MTIIKLSCIFVIVIFLVWRFIRLLYRFLEKKAQQIEERQESKRYNLENYEKMRLKIDMMKFITMIHHHLRVNNVRNPHNLLLIGVPPHAHQAKLI
ncbi:hypothetical protein AAHH71_29560 [Bacillus toyonensis]